MSQRGLITSDGGLLISQRELAHTPISRRMFLGASAAAGFSLALAGCSSGSGEDSHTSTGLASDCEVKDYPVTLTVVCDSHLREFGETAGTETNLDDPAGYDFDLTHPTNYAESLGQSYRNHVNRDVAFQFVFIDHFELLELCKAGEGAFSEGDGVIAWSSTIDAGWQAGALEGGDGGYMIRDNIYQDSLLVVRAKGTDDNLPETIALDGQDSNNGDINRIQQIPNYDGLIAIGDPASVAEGKLTVSLLESEGLYSSGSFDSSIADKLVVYDTQAEAMTAVATGECQLGFAYESSVNWSQYPDVEQAYAPPNTITSYDGCAIAGAPEPGVFRDFVEWLVVRGVQ